MLLELGEALGRGTKCDAVALELRTGKLATFVKAAEKVVELSLGDSVFKFQMAFYRRFMLLSIGSARATMFAVVAASIEEASQRAVRRERTTPSARRGARGHHTLTSIP